ncbi:MAG: hypothetical protein R3234_04910 [Thermoanaerobaculia bacterium]|nr:hypothetical protein [Thermoanaerobaculia bacterium]
MHARRTFEFGKISCILVCLGILLAGPLAAYTVHLRDGTTIQARERYRVEGNQAIITLPNGTETSLPLSEIDVERTEEANVVDYGDAVVLEDEGQARERQRRAEPEETREPSLTELAQRARARRAAEETEGPDEAAPAPDQQRLPRTPAGNVDLLRTDRTPLPSVEVGTLISQILRNQGIEGVSIYRGTRPGRILLEFTTNSEASVFRAIEASARALAEVERQRPGAVDAFELFMATDRRHRAGQFLMTPERAQELLTDQIQVPGFFLKYVQF